MDTTTPWFENNINIACHHATRLHTRRISIWDEYVCKLKVTRCLSGYTFSTSQVLDLALLSFASVTISSFSLSTVGCTSCPSASHWPTLMRDDEWKDRVDQHRPPSSYDSLKWTRLVQESNRLGALHYHQSNNGNHNVQLISSLLGGRWELTYPSYCPQ